MKNYIRVTPYEGRHRDASGERLHFLDTTDARTTRKTLVLVRKYAARLTLAYGSYPEVVCYAHGIPGAGGLQCIGGCEFCSPATGLEGKEGKEDTEGKLYPRTMSRRPEKRGRPGDEIDPKRLIAACESILFPDMLLLVDVSPASGAGVLPARPTSNRIAQEDNNGLPDWRK